MRRFWVLLSAIFFSGIHGALAQGECLSSLNVMSERTITFLNLGPDGQKPITTSMRCADAEKLRGEMFLSGKAISIQTFAQIQAFRQRLAQLESDLAAHRTNLEAATTRAARQTALAAAGTTVAAAITAGSVAGCVTTGTACLPALSGLIGIAATLSSISDTVGDLAAKALEGASAIRQAESLLRITRMRLTEAMADQFKLRYNAIFIEMCVAIRSQCL